MQSAWHSPEEMEHVLALLTPPNRLVARVMLTTGLRVSDVLALRKENVALSMTIVEQKTKKERTVFLTPELVKQLKGNGKRGWCFPGWRDSRKHRTRQAVWADLKRAAKCLRYERVSPHTCRKTFAVEYYKANGLEATQDVLNHDNPAVTLLYALSDVILQDKHRNKQKI